MGLRLTTRGRDPGESYDLRATPVAVGDFAGCYLLTSARSLRPPDALSSHTTPGLISPIAKERLQMPKGLDAATAQELIGNGLRSLAGEAVAAKAKPIVEAALEVARQSSRAAGKRTLSITGISVNSGDDEGSTTIYQVVGSGPPRRTPIGSREKRIPIVYGGDGYTCYLVSRGPPPFYVCLYF